MESIPVPYAIFMLLSGALAILVLVTPYLAFQKHPFANFLYDDFFSNLCHQKISRSLCLFSGPSGYSIGDCTPQTGEYHEDLRSEKSAVMNGVIGYKFPVSARDMAIYLGMFIGGLALLLAGRAASKDIPSPVLFILALVPLAIDGISQTVLGLRESTNLIRLITGLIAGFGVGVFAPIMLNKLFGRDNK